MRSAALCDKAAARTPGAIFILRAAGTNSVSQSCRAGRPGIYSLYRALGVPSSTHATTAARPGPFIGLHGYHGASHASSSHSGPPLFRRVAVRFRPPAATAAVLGSRVPASDFSGDAPGTLARLFPRASPPPPSTLRPLAWTCLHAGRARERFPFEPRRHHRPLLAPLSAAAWRPSLGALLCLLLFISSFSLLLPTPAARRSSSRSSSARPPPGCRAGAEAPANRPVPRSARRGFRFRPRGKLGELISLASSPWLLPLRPRRLCSVANPPPFLRPPLSAVGCPLPGPGPGPGPALARDLARMPALAGHGRAAPRRLPAQLRAVAHGRRPTAPR